MIVGVVSGKGGVGKTTVAINLATALTRIGHNVVLVDGNFSTPHVSLYLGSADVGATVRDVIKKRTVEGSLLVHSSGLHIISGDISNDAPIGQWGLHRLREALEGVEGTVFLDMPAGLDTAMLKFVDSVLVVTTPDLVAATDAYKTIKHCKKMGKTVLGVIVNRCSPNDMMSVEDVQGMVEENILGVLPEEYAVKRSMQMRHPVVYSHPETKISKAFINIAKHLTDHDTQVFRRLRQLR